MAFLFVSLNYTNGEYKKISNQSTLLSYYVIHSNKREYKIFCVNEKIHTKKEVPSVE